VQSRQDIIFALARDVQFVDLRVAFGGLVQADRDVGNPANCVEVLPVGYKRLLISFECRLPVAFDDKYLCEIYESRR